MMQYVPSSIFDSMPFSFEFTLEISPVLAGGVTLGGSYDHRIAQSLHSLTLLPRSRYQPFSFYSLRIPSRMETLAG